MVTQASFSLISTPIAHCDRRALSQAWYSALHLEQSPQHALAAPQPITNRAGACALAHARPTAVGTASHSVAQGNAHRSGRIAPAGGSDGGSGERRSARSTLARKIERIFCAPNRTLKSASFRLGQGTGRVQILVRQRGENMHLVALCAPAAKDIVARALAQARYALCARGIAVHTDVRAFNK